MDRALHNLPLQTLIRTLGVGALIVLIGAYVHFQARNLISGPSIELPDAPNGVVRERLITLTGTARNIVKLTVNGCEIHTDEHGLFREALVLENGYTIATLRAEDRFGRTTTLTREYVYEREI